MKIKSGANVDPIDATIVCVVISRLIFNVQPFATWIIQRVFAHKDMHVMMMEIVSQLISVSVFGKRQFYHLFLRTKYNVTFSNIFFRSWNLWQKPDLGYVWSESM